MRIKIKPDGFIDSLKNMVLGYEHRFYPRLAISDAHEKIFTQIKRFAQEEVLIVSDLDPEFYEYATFKSAVYNFIDRAREENFPSGVPLKIASCKSRQRLERENPFLIELSKKGNAELWIPPGRPVHHFICIDGNGLFLIEDHAPNCNYGSFFMERTTKLGEEYGKNFLDLTKRASKLEFVLNNSAVN